MQKPAPAAGVPMEHVYTIAAIIAEIAIAVIGNAVYSYTKKKQTSKPFF